MSVQAQNLGGRLPLLDPRGTRHVAVNVDRTRDRRHLL
jgi:hypothetical protein